MTIVRGTLPVELYGRDRYGAMNGAMATPVLIAKAAGPFLASLIFGVFGGYDSVLITLITVAAIGAVVFTVALVGRRDVIATSPSAVNRD